jgi:plastocyanin
MNPLVRSLALAALAVAGRSDSGITIRTFAFGPRTHEVVAGTTVVWTNMDDIEHTVTSGTPDRPDGAFDHPLPKRGATAGVRFDSVGVWPYFCKRHSFMRGEVRVTPKGAR